MKPSFKSTMLAVFAGCISFVTLADSQWYAKPNGADDADCTDPATAGSIAAAMAKAAAADGASVITLADGDYDIAALTPVTENSSKAFFVVKKDLTLVSAGGDPANCRLIGGGEENRSRFLLIPSAASVALGGITVTNFWDSAEDRNYLGGGAIFANGTSVSLAISGCVFADNHTRRPEWASGISGGAINGGTLDITDTSFVGNMAITGSDETGSGGAFCSGSIVQLKDCLFKGNNSSSRGGAIYFNGGSAVPVERCTFVGNGSPTAPGMPSLHRVNYYYGVIYANGSYTLKNCTFRENVHEIWGAGHMFGVSGSGNVVSCSDCTFEANQAMNLCGDGSITLCRCRFTGNTFKQMNANAPTLIESCLFSGTRFSESAAYFGAGPYYNCTFVNNKCNNGSVFSANAQLFNCIVTADNHVSATASFTASHCIWNANGKGNLVGEGNITDLTNDAAIKFVGLGDDPYAITLDSPARDKGDNVLGYTAADRDLIGGSRLVRALDIGAYEYQIAAFEADIETQVFDGVNGCEPHPVVTDAETQAVLEEGTDYTLSWSNNERTGMGTMKVTGINGYAGKTANIDFKIVSQYGDGLTFYAEVGGSDDADCVNWATAGSITAAMAKAAAAQGAAIVAFADGDYDIGALTPVTENSSTSFFIAKKDLTLVSAGGDPANCRFIGGGEEGTRGRFLLVSSAESVALRGLTVTNFWDSTADTGLKGGGAVLVNGTTISLAVTNCVFADNHIWRSEWTSGVSGGAINGGALDITDSSFIGNTAITGHDETGTGGAVCGKIVRLESCRFERNASSSRGGAIYASAAIDAPIKDCTFDNNDTSVGMPTRRAPNYYGVIFVNGGFALEDCMFRGNKMNAWLASMIGANGSIDCHDCVFEDNTTMYVFGSGNVSVSRCRLTANKFLNFNPNTPVLNENCLFVQNSFSERQHYFGVGPYHNCTFVGNTANGVSAANGGVFSNGAKLINCIVTADNQVNPTAASYTYYATNCIWNASGRDTCLNGTGNITDLANDAAIKFVGTGDDPYAIGIKSPARDKGANVRGYTKDDRDLIGNPRLSREGLLDIGCYEYQMTPGLMLLLR